MSNRLHILLLLVSFNQLAFSQSLVKKFFQLPGPEKCWVIFHPFKAKGVYQISEKAIQTTLTLKNDTTLDGDINGGQLDAFRHAYWMAMIAQKYGARFALRLGKIHEKANYRMYKKNRMEEGTLPDYESSLMDFLNNDVGIEIGKQYKTSNEEEIMKQVIDLIHRGKLFIIKKDTKNNYLNCDGEILILKKGEWKTGKCIVPSNTPRSQYE